jgi:hypothetical protein
VAREFKGAAEARKWLDQEAAALKLIMTELGLVRHCGLLANLRGSMSVNRCLMRRLAARETQGSQTGTQQCKRKRFRHRLERGVAQNSVEHALA